MNADAGSSSLIQYSIFGTEFTVFSRRCSRRSGTVCALRLPLRTIKAYIIALITHHIHSHSPRMRDNATNGCSWMIYVAFRYGSGFWSVWTEPTLCRCKWNPKTLRSKPVHLSIAFNGIWHVTITTASSELTTAFCNKRFLDVNRTEFTTNRFSLCLPLTGGFFFRRTCSRTDWPTSSPNSQLNSTCCLHIVS